MPRSAVKLTASSNGKVWDMQNRALDLEAKFLAATKNAAKANANAAAAKKNSKNNNNNNKNNSKDAVAAATAASIANEAVDRLRVPLCECMAEMLLVDAEFSWHYHVVDRLFKQCFYQRIGPQRSEIWRAQRRNNAPLVERLQTSLHHSLGEAIRLYVYLTDKLEQKLLPPGNSQDDEDASYTQTQSTFGTTTSTSDGEEEENLEFIVPVLNLLYVQLGDLHRYANELPQAQARYEVAARLGPGHGHAYNQIAVTCQLKEQQGSSPLSAVALYWYARSLLPTVSPFSQAAHANLNRLFASNRAWLLQQQQQQSNINNNNNNNNNALPATVVTHATKAAAVRTFLAEFCDLQYDFYQGISVSSSDSMTTSPTTTTASANATAATPTTTTTAIMALKKMAHLVESLQGLLQLSAFGDALVCKMVTILAFSECHVPTTITTLAAAAVDAGNSNNKTSSNNSNNNIINADMLRTTALVARTATYQMATLLADKVLQGLRKLKAAAATTTSTSTTAAGNTKNTTATSHASIRLLLPLLLVAEFTAHREQAAFFSTGASSNHSHKNRNTTSDWMVTTSEYYYDVHYKQAMQAFWKKMVDVWNLLHPWAIAMQVDETKVDGLQEYEALRGFAPFSSFIISNTSTTAATNDLPPGFLTAQESVPVIMDKNYNTVINATKSDTAAGAARNSTQETNSTKGSTSSSSSSSQLEQGRIKIARMLALAKSLADDLMSELGLCICRMSTGEYAWIENKEQKATAFVTEQHHQQQEDDYAMMEVMHNNSDDDTDSPQRHGLVDHNRTATTSSAPLVYQQAAGGGPALLVPGALLQNQGGLLPPAAVNRQNNSVVSAAAAATPRPQLSAVAEFGNVGGFDSSRMTLTREQEPQQSVNNGVDLRSMLLREPPGIMSSSMQPPAPVNPPPGFSPSPAPIAGFDLHTMGLMPPGLVVGAIPPSQPMQPMSDSLHFLGGVSMATANPFATTTTATANSKSIHDFALDESIIPPLHPEDTSFLCGGDDDEMAGVDLLGSGLFQSLWGGNSGADAKGAYSTNNPFAAS